MNRIRGIKLKFNDKDDNSQRESSSMHNIFDNPKTLRLYHRELQFLSGGQKSPFILLPTTRKARNYTTL